MAWAFLAYLGATLYLTGVAWAVQLTLYPLFARVSASEFRDYHSSHTRSMGWVVFLPMTAELLTSAVLALFPPPGLPRPFLVAGLLCALGTWGVTAVFAIPLHGRLSEGFDPETHRRLLRAHRLRTFLWTVHALLLLELTRRLIAPAFG